MASTPLLQHDLPSTEMRPLPPVIEAVFRAFRLWGQHPLALWGIERVLARRLVSAFLLLVTAIALHPLMGLPSLVLAVGLLLAQRIGVRKVLLLGSAAVVLVVLAFAVLPASLWPGPKYDA